GGLRNFVDFQPARVSSFANGVGTLLASPIFASANERPMDFAMIGGLPVLATVNTETSVVRIYDMSDPDAPVLLDSATTITSASVFNDNGVGQVRFGNVTGDDATLYALNTNNGIQAFNVHIPEPGAASILPAAAAAMLARRRRLCSRLCRHAI
ncbi:MAG: hypothetical protein ABIP55_03330, partial [Tepidisphaeraceae bacterium]